MIEGLGGGGGGSGDKATSAASAATSGNNFGGLAEDGGLSPLGVIVVSSLAIFGFLFFAWLVVSNRKG